MPEEPFSRRAFSDAARALAATARTLAERGFTPATSGNFSLRLDDRHLVITASGRDKGRLTEDDFLVVDLDGRALSAGRPSAETLLHAELYRRGLAGAVLHTHSRTQTVASRIFAAAGEVRLAGYELLKAFAGIDTHATTLAVPVLANTQDMAALARDVGRRLAGERRFGYLIAGHGLYVWGDDLEQATRHLEAFEFLLACELDMRRTT